MVGMFILKLLCMRYENCAILRKKEVKGSVVFNRKLPEFQFLTLAGDKPYVSLLKQITIINLFSMLIG